MTNQFFLPVASALLSAWCLLLATMAPAAHARANNDSRVMHVFPIRDGDLHGLINVEGKVVLPVEFADIRLGDPLIMARKGNRTAYFDYDGRMVIDPQDELRQPFAEGLIPMRGKDAQGKPSWGYGDHKRQMTIAPAFDEAQAFVDGLAVVGMTDAWGVMKYGAIDRSGKLVLPTVHAKLLTPGGGLVRAESAQRTHRVFDSRGRDITPPGVDFVGIVSDGMVRVWTGRLQGFMAVDGKLLVPPRFAQASDFKQGLARVWQGGKFGYIDKRGELVIPVRYDSAEDFSDGLALVKEGEKTLFLSREGKTVLQPNVERAWPFSEGLAVVKTGGKHGYINKQGATVIEPKFNFARPFTHGLAYVGQGRLSGYIRPDGGFVWQSDR